MERSELLESTSLVFGQVDQLIIVQEKRILNLPSSSILSLQLPAESAETEPTPCEGAFVSFVMSQSAD